MAIAIAETTDPEDAGVEPDHARRSIGSVGTSGPEQGRGVAEAEAVVRTVGVKLRVHPDTLERVRYWAAKGGLSHNEFMTLAVERAVSDANRDYDLPALEVQRLNQLVDEHKALSENVRNLERVVTDGLGSLLALARGDDYLLSADVEI